MTRGMVLVLMIGLISKALSAREAWGDERRANVVVILADDLGFGSVGCYGAAAGLVRTPHIDRLAREGRRFVDATTPCSVCTPTRYALLTGRYCWRTPLTHGVLGVFEPLMIEPARPTLASLLKAQGYDTAAVGKWHLGYGPPGRKTDYAAELSPGPLDIGFDHHFAVPSNHGDVTGVYVQDRFTYGLRSRRAPDGDALPGPAVGDGDFQESYALPSIGGGPRKGDRALTIAAARRRDDRVMPVLTDRAVAWLRDRPRDRSFFLYFAPVAIHSPDTPSAATAGTSTAGVYGDWIHELDRSVGAILAVLDETGAADSTLVIFTSDNGGVAKPEKPALPSSKAAARGLQVNGSWRGGKHDIWEGGFRVPFIVRWPGHVPAGTETGSPVSLVDLVATVASVLDIPFPGAEGAAEDSRDVRAALLGESESTAREDIVEQSAAGVFAIRRGRWKWVEGVPDGPVTPAVRRQFGDQFEPRLFDLAADPGETTDLASEHPEVVADLRERLGRIRRSTPSR